MKRRRFAAALPTYGTLAVCLASYLAAFAQSRLSARNPAIEPTWFLHAAVVLAFMAACSVAIFVTRKRSTVALLLALRLALYYVLGPAVRDTMGMKIVLVTTLLVEAGLRLDVPENVAAVALVVLAAAAMEGSESRWQLALSDGSSHGLLAVGLYALVVGALAASLRALMGELERRDLEHDRLSLAVTRLSAANTDFQRYAQLVEEKSREGERRRVSREIHDTVGYTLTNIRMMMEAATRLADKEPQEVKPLLTQARAQAESGLAETRAALRALRSLAETALSGVRAIQHVTRAFSEATGVEVEVDYGNLPWEPDPEVDGVLYRIVQEGMTNAFRHGGATHVSVRFSVRDREIEVIVRDNGRGAEDLDEGIGLTGMRERVEQLGGRVSARNVAGGFEVVACLPEEIQHQAHQSPAGR